MPISMAAHDLARPVLDMEAVPGDHCHRLLSSLDPPRPLEQTLALISEMEWVQKIPLMVVAGPSITALAAVYDHL